MQKYKNNLVIAIGLWKSYTLYASEARSSNKYILYIIVITGL